MFPKIVERVIKEVVHFGHNISVSPPSNHFKVLFVRSSLLISGKVSELLCPIKTCQSPSGRLIKRIISLFDGRGSLLYFFISPGDHHTRYAAFRHHEVCICLTFDRVSPRLRGICGRNFGLRWLRFGFFPSAVSLSNLVKFEPLRNSRAF